VALLVTQRRGSSGDLPDVVGDLRGGKLTRGIDELRIVGLAFTVVDATDKPSFPRAVMSYGRVGLAAYAPLGVTFAAETNDSLEANGVCSTRGAPSITQTSI